MRANIELLKKALKIVANVHQVEFADWSDECELGIKSYCESVNTDVRKVCKAFYGKDNMVTANNGYTSVCIDEEPLLDEIDDFSLRFVLGGIKVK